MIQVILSSSGDPSLVLRTGDSNGVNSSFKADHHHHHHHHHSNRFTRKVFDLTSAISARVHPSSSSSIVTGPGSHLEGAAHQVLLLLLLCTERKCVLKEKRQISAKMRVTFSVLAPFACCVLRMFSYDLFFSFLVIFSSSYFFWGRKSSVGQNS